jgi:ribosomal protein L28
MSGIPRLGSKQTSFGRRIRHQHSGAWERKAPKKSRQFKPNVQRKRMFIDGKWQRVKVDTRYLRTEMKHMQDAGTPY